MLSLCSDQLELYMQGQEKAILEENETEDHDPTTHVIGLTLSLLSSFCDKCWLIVVVRLSW